jgi:hypothetical protein
LLRILRRDFDGPGFVHQLVEQKEKSMRRSIILAIAIVGSGLLAGCDQNVKTGGGSGPVSGAAAGSSANNVNAQLEHCDKALGTLAIEEDTTSPWYAVLTGQYRLPATTPLIRLMIQQSNCFVIVERGHAMQMMQRERALADSGELRSGSKMGAGQMVAADYTVSPSIQFAQQTGGGGAQAVASSFSKTAALGAIMGGIRQMEAATTLLLIDNRSGVQVAAAEGSARKTDFDFGALIGVGHVGVGVSGWQSTPEGKLLAGAFMDSYNQMIRALRSYAPQHASKALGTGGSLAVEGAEHAAADNATGAGQGAAVASAQARLIDMGLLQGKADGIAGPATRAAISKFQKIRGLPVTGELDGPTADALSH